MPAATIDLILPVALYGVGADGLLAPSAGRTLGASGQTMAMWVGLFVVLALAAMLTIAWAARRGLRRRERALERERDRRRQAEAEYLAQQERLSEYNRALIRLSRCDAIAAGDFEAACREITKAAAEATGTERVSVWLFTEDHTAIQCQDLFERSANRHSNDILLQAADFPAYFLALEANRTIAADDAQSDHRTCEFKEGYLRPLGITSMMDSLVQVGGRTVGVICHEHVGPMRQWSVEEQTFASSIADLAALALESSERRHATAALGISEEQFRQVFEEGPVAMHLVRPDFRIMRVNNALCRLLGYGQSELIDRPLVDIVHPDDREATLQRARMMRDGEIRGFQLERRYVHKRGTPIWTAVRGSVVRDESGAAVFGIGMIENISERKRTNEALQAVAEGVSASLGSAFFRSLVRSLAEVTGVDYAFVGSVEGAEPDTVRTIAVWARGEPGENFSYALADTPCANVVGQHLCVHPSGVQHSFPEDVLLQEMGIESYAGAPLIDSHGETVGLLVVLHSEPFVQPELIVSLLRLFGIRAAAELEREEHDRLIHESEARFRTLVEHAPEAIVVLDTNTGMFVDANRNAEELFGLPRGELLEQGPVQLSPPTQPDGTETATFAATMIQRAMEGETPVFEWTHRRTDGADVPCEIRLVRLPSKGRKLVRGSITDISARKRSEQRQQLMMQELDHRVKNNLAAVLSLATQTVQTSSSLDAFHRSFIGRIQAMAKTHEGLARTRWEGGDLEHLVRLVIEPHVQESNERITVTGPNLILPSRSVMPLCMTLHELVTNATKYGALTVPSGTVSVDWRVEAGVFHLAWCEHGGPPVQPPQVEGTGLTLIRGFIDYELRGRSRFDFRADGLVASFSFALEQAGL